MFHIQNSINACTGYSADHIKWLTGVSPQGTIHPDLPRTVFQGSQVSLRLIWICVRLMYTSDNSAALGVGCIRSKSNINWMHWTWRESSSQTCRFWGKFVSMYFPTKICVLHLGRCRCSFLLPCVKELLTCKRWNAFFFDLATPLFCLGPNDKSSALPFASVPLLHNPALSPRIRKGAQAFHMKLKWTTNVKILLAFLGDCPFRCFFTSLENKI